MAYSLNTHTEAGIFVSRGFKLVRAFNINLCISLQGNLSSDLDVFLPLRERILVPYFPACRDRVCISEEEKPKQQGYFPVTTHANKD